jgi:hypothetical protein
MMLKPARDFDSALIADLNSRLAVGTLVIAQRATGVCSVGEPGMCYERYEVGGRPGWSFIFAKGGYDGFSPSEVADLLLIKPMIADYLRDYRFTNVTRLANDYRRGLFNRAFELVHPPHPAKAFPHP